MAETEPEIPSASLRGTAEASLLRERGVAVELVSATTPDQAAAVLLAAAREADGIDAAFLCTSAEGETLLRPAWRAGVAGETGSLCLCPAPESSGCRPELAPCPGSGAGPGFRCLGRLSAPSTGPVRAALALFSRGAGPDAAGLATLAAATALAAPVLFRVRAEEALAESESRYQSLVRNCPVGVYVFDPRTLRMRSANRKFLALLGYSEAEVTGLGLETIVASPLVSVTEVLEKGVHFLGERLYRRRDGTTVEVEVTAVLVRRRAGALVQVFVRDISDREKSRKALELAQRRNELILGSAGEGILGLDRHGRHTFVNPAATRLLGFPSGELVGRVSHSIWHHTRRDGSPYPPEACPIYAAFSDGRVHRVSNEVFWRKDGTSFPVEYVSSPILEEGHPTGAVVVFRDTSKEARLEAITEAMETMNSIGYVFSAVRHELGNPVNSVKTALTVLRANLERLGTARARGYLDRSLAELARVEDLLASLRSFGMYEDVAVRPLALGPFTEEFARFISPDFEKRGIRVAVDAQAESLTVLADPRALRQVLLNLLTNAADAMESREDPSIVLEAFGEQGLAGLRIHDNGFGMSEETLRNLFKPFHTTKPSGTGLGLVIAKKMMARMKGTIDVESRAGAGTTVVLTLRSGESSD